MRPSPQKSEWFTIAVALLLFVFLIWLYSKLPSTQELLKNIIIGGLIFTLFLYLALAVSKSIKFDFVQAVNRERELLINDIGKKVMNLEEKLRFDREQIKKEIIKSLEEATGFQGEIIKGLMRRLKQRNETDLNLYTFYGLQGLIEDSNLQDFNLKGGTINAVSFFWADTSSGNKITASINKEERCLQVGFDNRSNGGSNLAIRLSGDMAHIKAPKMRYLTFDVRIKEVKEGNDYIRNDNIRIGFRVVNGWLQHWHYAKRDAFITLSLREYPFKIFPQTKKSNWIGFSLDLEEPSRWHLFESDGNYLYGPIDPDFSIISTIIFEFGGILEEEKESVLTSRPGIGKGELDIGHIRLTEEKIDYLIN